MMGATNLAMPKPTKPIRSRIVDVEVDPDHRTYVHDQAGPDVVPAGPKAAGYDTSRLLLSQLYRGSTSP
jgi:hypothetical protein